MSNIFPSATARNPDLFNLAIIHTEANALQTQILIDRGLGLRETILSNTVLTSSTIGTVKTPVNRLLAGGAGVADQDTTAAVDTGSFVQLNGTTITFQAQVDGTNGVPNATTAQIIITSSVTGSGAVPGPDPITGLGGQTMTVNTRVITFTDTGGGNTTQAQAVVDINAVLTVTQGITATFAVNVITLTKTAVGTDLTEDIDITAGTAVTTLNLTIGTTTPTGSLIFGGTANQTININAARSLNELVADINTDVATHGITASARDTGVIDSADRFVLRLTKANNTNGVGIDIDSSSTALILTELGLTAAVTVVTLDDADAQFATASATSKVSSAVIDDSGTGAGPFRLELSTNLDSGKIEMQGPVLVEGTVSTADETGAGFLTGAGTLTFGGTATQDVVFGAAASLLGVVATINLTTANHGIIASSYDTGVVGASRYHLRLTKLNSINGTQNIIIDAGSTAQVLTDLGLTAGTTSTTFLGFTVSPATFYIDLATETITLTAHGFATGDQVQVISDGTLPSPLKGFPDSFWYIINVGANNLRIAQTNALALAGTPVDLAQFGVGSFQIKALLESERYFEVWKGLLTDRVLKQHMDEVISHFEELQYIIFRRTNVTTLTTFDWIVRW